MCLIAEPRFTFDKDQYDVDEDAGTLKVVVNRQGSDLSIDSSVLFATKQWRPLSARGTAIAIVSYALIFD